MKHKLSISVEEELILKVFDMLRSKKFRNKSHFFEVAAAHLIEKETS